GVGAKRGRMVGPSGVDDSIIKGDTSKIAELIGTAIADSIGRPTGNLDVGRKGIATVRTAGGEDNRVGVYLPVGIACAATVIKPAIVPRDGDIAGRLVNGQVGPELAAGAGVVVDPETLAPSRAVVIRETNERVSICTADCRGVCKDKIDAAS